MRRRFGHGGEMTDIDLAALQQRGMLEQLWPLLAFLLAAGAIALKRYRQTLD